MVHNRICDWFCIEVNLYGWLGISARCGIQKNDRLLRGLASLLILILSLFGGFSQVFGFFVSGLVLFEAIKGFCFVRFLRS